MAYSIKVLHSFKFFCLSKYFVLKVLISSSVITDIYKTYGESFRGVPRMH